MLIFIFLLKISICLIKFCYIQPKDCDAVICEDYIVSTEMSAVLIILRPSDIACQQCYGSFLAICDSIDKYIVGISAFGILVIESNIADGIGKNKLIKIHKKKLRGFIKGNNIKFPILVDEHNIFEAEMKEESSIILLSGSFKIIRRWKLPLGTDDVEELSMLLSTAVNLKNRL